MKYSIFDNTKIIDLPDNLINMYEKYRGKLDDVYIEHMIIAYDLDKDNSIKAIELGVIEAIEDEISVFSNGNKIIKKAIKAGVIK